MRLNLLCPNRLKRAQTDVQGDKAELNSALCQLVEQGRRKMQPGSRSGDRTWLPGIDRLIALPVGGMSARRTA